MHSPRRSFTRWLAVAPLLLTLACDADPTSEEPIDLEARSLVGVVEGTDLALGALLDGDTLTIYQCGGDETFDTHTQWFRGDIGNDDGPNEFEMVSEDFTIMGTRTADGLEGELVEPDGTRHEFHVDPVAEGSDAGVYVADHQGGSAGVIVRQSGDALVAQGASCTGTPRRCNQVIILAPLTIESESIDVQIDVNGTFEDLRVDLTLTAPSSD